MHDPAAVQRLQGAEDAEGDLQGLGQGNGLAGDPLRQRLAGEQLHHQIELASIFGELVDVADVGVVDAGGGARLAEEALPQPRVVGRLADALDGDRAVQSVVMRCVHHAHPALTQLASDAVATDDLRLEGRVHGLPSPAEHRAPLGGVPCGRRYRTIRRYDDTMIAQLRTLGRCHLPYENTVESMRRKGGRRTGRDSNPRNGLSRLHALQACAFNHSATCPDSLRGRNLAARRSPVNAVSSAVVGLLEGRSGLGYVLAP